MRPLRDVLLGLFFVGIDGMLIDPRALLQVWHLALLGAAVLLVVKTLLVALIVRRAGIDPITAWRTGSAAGGRRRRGSPCSPCACRPGWSVRIWGRWCSPQSSSRWWLARY